MLPAPRYPLCLRSGEQNLHIPAAGFCPSARPAPPLFAPPSPLTLMPPFRGAKSSHSRRRILPLRAPGASSLCSPFSANPCGSVSGSKIFTFQPPDFAPPRARRPPDFALPHARRRHAPQHAAARPQACGAAPPLPHRKKHRAAQSLLGAFLSSLSIIPIPLLPPAQS